MKEKQKNYTGKVVLKKFGEGSKSEHNAVYLETEDDIHVIRRIGGNPFNDPELRKLIGKNISAKGFIDKAVLFVKDIEENEEST